MDVQSCNIIERKKPRIEKKKKYVCVVFVAVKDFVKGWIDAAVRGKPSYISEVNK